MTYPKTLPVQDQKNMYSCCAGFYKKLNLSPSVVRIYATWKKKSNQKNPQNTQKNPITPNTGISEENIIIKSNFSNHLQLNFSSHPRYSSIYHINYKANYVLRKDTKK